MRQTMKIRANELALVYSFYMRSIAFRAIAIFFVLLVATSLLIDLGHMPFGSVNFWDKHGVFFLICIAIFPRLTLLFSSVPFGGLLWWAGLIICPRILVATLATIAHFHTNPVLVIISWMIALGGEVFEKWGIGSSRFQVHYRRGPTATYHAPEEAHPSSTTISHGDIIDAEFTKK